MKKLVSIILIMFILVGCGSKKEQKNEVKSISTQSVYNMVKEQDDYILIDVRTKEEYDEGHIKSSINIPLDNISSISYDKDSKIIVYCRSGARSSEAAKKLISLGYTDVNDMGGLNNWKYEVEY